MKYQVNNLFKSSAGNVAWGVEGEGPDVVLVHGTPASSIIWSGIIDRLNHRYRFHYFDLPGYGASEQFEGQEVRLRAFARVLREFIHHRQLNKPHLVGHDFGAATIMGAHLIEGEPVASLTIADGVLLTPWGTPFSRHVREYEAVFSAVPDYIHQATLSAHLKTAVAHPLPADIETAFIKPWTGTIGQAAYYRQVAQYDYEYTQWLEAKYAEVKVPLAILWGEEDQWVKPSEAQRFQGMVRGAELYMLPDAGHFSMIDSPGLFARELDGILSRRISSL